MPTYPPCKEIQIPKFETCLLVESRIMGLGIQDHAPWNPESWALGSRIPLKIETQNPSSTDKESGIHYLDSGIQNVESRNGYKLQHAKKVVSDSPGLVDFGIGLVNSVVNLPEGQVKFFEKF